MFTANIKKYLGSVNPPIDKQIIRRMTTRNAQKDPPKKEESKLDHLMTIGLTDASLFRLNRIFLRSTFTAFDRPDGNIPAVKERNADRVTKLSK
jgi:hypothetical protein